MTNLEVYQQRMKETLSWLYRSAHSNNKLQKAYMRYFLCFQQRNANMTQGERVVARQPDPFVTTSGLHYWRFRVGKSHFVGEIKTIITDHLSLSTEAKKSKTSTKELQIKWLVVLNRGEAAGVVEELGLLLVQTTPFEQFLKEKIVLKEGCYLLTDEASNTEVLWALKEPRQAALSSFSKRGMMPDYQSMVELYLNTVYLAPNKRPNSMAYSLCEVDTKQTKKHLGCSLKKQVTEEQLGSMNQVLGRAVPEVGAEMYRQLILILFHGLKRSSIGVRRIMWESVMPYLNLTLISTEDKTHLQKMVCEVTKRMSELDENVGSLHQLMCTFEEAEWPWQVYEYFMLDQSWVRKVTRYDLKYTLDQLFSCLDTFIFYQWQMAYERILEVVLMDQSIECPASPPNFLYTMAERMMPASQEVHSHIFPYAMNAIYHLASHIMRSIGSGAHVVCLKNVYFEINKHLKLPTVDSLGDIQGEPDFLIADMHTNNALSERLHMNDVHSWLMSYMKRSKKKLHVLLDLTLNNPDEEEVRALTQLLHSNKQINLYIVISLTKMMQLGVDLLSGGAVFAMGENVKLPTSWPVRKSHTNAVFEILSKADIVGLRKTYFRLLRGNVEKIYHGLQEALLSDKEPCLFHVGLSQDDKQVYVAIRLELLFERCDLPSFNTKKEDPVDSIAILIQETLLCCAQSLGIRLSGRNSFGFASSSLNVVCSALRLTGGVEPEDVINQMVAFISVLIQELSVKMIKVNQRGKITQEKLKECLNDLQVACREVASQQMILDQAINITSEYRPPMTFTQALSFKRKCIVIRNEEYGIDQMVPASFALHMRLRLRRGMLYLCEDDMFQLTLPLELGQCWINQDERITQTQGQKITVTVLDDAIQTWQLDGQSIQVTVNLKASGKDQVSYKKTDQMQRRCFFKKFLAHRAVLDACENEGGGLYYHLSFSESRQNQCDDAAQILDQNQMLLWQVRDFEKKEYHRYGGLIHAKLDQRYQHKMSKKIMGFLEYVKFKKAPKKSLALWVIWQQLKIRKHSSLRHMMNDLTNRLDIPYLSVVQKQDWLFKLIAREIQSGIGKYASELYPGIWKKSSSCKNTPLRSLLKDAIRWQLLRHMRKATLAWNNMGFWDVSFDPEFLSRWLKNQREFHASEYRVIQQWLKNSTSSLSDMIDTGAGWCIHYFRFVPDFGEKHQRHLVGFWQYVSTNFLDNIGFRPGLLAQDLEECIIWYYQLAKVCGDIAVEFRSMLSAIIRVKMSDFPVKHQVQWLLRYSDYDEDTWCGYLYLTQGERAMLGSWLWDIGLVDALRSEAFYGYLLDNHQLDLCQEQLSHMNDSLGLRGEDQIQLAQRV